MSVPELISLFEKPEDLWIYEGKNYVNPYRILMDETGPLAWRVPQVKQAPWLNKYLVRWIVLRASREIIGSISFHGGASEVGMIEIGLGIDARFRNQGYGMEALAGMWIWVCQQEGVKILRYTVSSANLASVALIKKFGFKHVGQQLDEADGPEEIYELSVEDFKKLTLYL